MLNNKFLAFVIFIALSGLVVVLLYKHKSLVKKIIIIGCVLLISFFPVMFAEITLRIISIQLFIIYFIIIYFLSKIKIRASYAYLILVIILLFNVRASFILFNSEVELETKTNDCIAKLDGFLNNSGNNCYVTVSPYGIFIPYKYYYFKYGRIGKFPIPVAPIGYTYYFKNFYTNELYNKNDTLLSADIAQDIVTLKSEKNYISNFISPGPNLEIIEKIPNTIRGLREIKYKLPHEYTGPEWNKIYFNGIDWLPVKQ